MELEDSEKQLTKKEFESFESTLKVSFPKDFVDFYLTFNGGFPSHSYFEGKEISYFAPIKYGEQEYTITGTIQRLSELGRLPNGLIPFANDPGGWNFCIDLNETNYGVIYLLPNGIEDQSPIFVAQSFDNFISNLSVEDDC